MNFKSALPYYVAAIAVIWIMSSKTPSTDSDTGPVGPVKVLIVEESSQRGKLDRTQEILLSSVRLKTIVESGGGTFMTLDQDSIEKNPEMIQYLPKFYQDALKHERATLPWIYITNGSKGTSVALPKTFEETAALIRKYSGDRDVSYHRRQHVNRFANSHGWSLRHLCS